MFFFHFRFCGNFLGHVVFYLFSPLDLVYRASSIMFCVSFSHKFFFQFIFFTIPFAVYGYKETFINSQSPILEILFGYLKASFWGLFGLIPGTLIFQEHKFFKTYFNSLSIRQRSKDLKHLISCNIPITGIA